MKYSKRLLAVAVSAALSAPATVFATNGMNMEGYGPIATGMGGASMAYDNGTAAMMNNPATLSMQEEDNRLDLALGVLGPDVSASHPMAPMDWDSDSTAFYMPALGWARRSGDFTYGIGAFAQGGMGTDYDGGGPGTAFVQMDMMMAGDNPAVVSGWDEFSEVGVMRILFPVSYKVNSDLNVAGSLDYVRANMDLQMAMPAGTMMDMMMNPSSTVGTITTNMGFPGMPYGGYFDFADSSPYSGAASGDGFAAKLGFTYQASPELTIGGTYHSKTSIGDLTGSGTMSIAYDDGGTGAVMTVPGNYTVDNFQWPTTFALGMSYQASPKLMIAADVKRINWSEVMSDFKVRFDGTGPAAGAYMDATMYQDWEDQTAVQLGAAYDVTNATTLRVGANISSNPIPDDTVHYLFPATVENHYTFGVGHELSADSDVNFSLTYAPEVSVTGSNPDSNQGLNIDHGQLSWQLMYSKTF